MLVGSKRPRVKGWSKIEAYDVKKVRETDNGFAIVTGHTHVMV